MVLAPPSVDPAELSAWCEEYLGAPPTEELFTSAHLSRVVGLRLADGTSVVVKIRATAHRLRACFDVHLAMFEAGFPCPQPLVGPTPIGDFSATAERYLPGGTPLPIRGRSPQLFASALVRLVDTAPEPEEVGPLNPPPPWTAWDHAEDGLWPWPDDSDVDLNKVDGPAWVDDAAAAVRERLATCDLPRVIGHGDWYTSNLRWSGDELVAVHDWDSVISAPEPVVAGLAAASFASGGGPGEEVTVAETEAFIAAYQQASRRALTEGEMSYAWAAGLWLRVFDAKKEFATRGYAYSCDEPAATERLRRMGHR